MIVWGTGLIEPVKPAQSKHHYVAVRGCETRNCIRNIDANVVLGDPGLLAHLLIDNHTRRSKTHRVGLICHYKDKNNPTVAQICERHTDIVEIDIFAPVQQILEQIMACEVIFSSAMHGLIAADALGIPNAWMQLSDRVKGAGFKFRDYYSVFGMEAQPLTLEDQLVTDQLVTIVDNYQRKGIDKIQRMLIDCFPF